MWAILKWRLSPTVANLLAIPKPYQPTMLQCNTPDHALTIDFIAWTCIRDQLILKFDQCDIDMVMRDLVLHTVFEVHHQKIAVNVYDFYQHKILAGGQYTEKNANGDTIVNPRWTWRYATVTPGFTLFDPNCAGQEHLIREISWRMPFSTPSHVEGNDFVSRYGVDQCMQWKLSKTFAQRYPFLDCSTGMYYD